MRFKHLILAGMAMAVLGACGERNDNGTDADIAIGGANIEENVTPAVMEPGGDAAFANKVAASDQFEIASGQAAAANATSADIKNFGTMLVAEHQKSTADLTAAIGSDLILTPTLDAEQSSMLTALKAAKGPAFDKLFLEQQVAAHTKTHQLLTDYSASGGSEPLKAFAAKTAPVVKKHLDEAEVIAGVSR